MRKAQDFIQIHVLFQVRGQLIQCCFNILAIVAQFGFYAQLRQKRGAKGVIAEHAMQIAANDAPVWGYCPICASINRGKGAVAIGTRGLADMNFIPLKFQIGCTVVCVHLGQHLVRGHDRIALQ